MRERSRSKDRHSSSKRRDRSRSRERKKEREQKERRKEKNRHKKREDRSRSRESRNERPEPRREERHEQQHQQGSRKQRQQFQDRSQTSPPTPPQPVPEKKVQSPTVAAVPSQPMPNAQPNKLSSIELATARAAALAPPTVAGASAPGAVELPSYYNPAAINVTKYTTQIQKRKLLWSNKDAKPNAEKWQQTAQFSRDEDGKVASKFMRLMGIKTAPAPAAGDEAGKSDGSGTGKKPTDFAKKQADMFSSMERQYEVARQATHTMRGMGLGFSRQY